jgi:H+/gluconate symporter-like permease
MVEVASTISTEPWKYNFQSEILRTIEAKILPEVRAVDDQLKASYQKMFGSAIGKFGLALSKVIAPTLPTMTMATVLGLSMGQVVLLGAAAAVSGAGIALPEMISYRQEKKKIERNGLAFLLRFGRSIYEEEFR